MCTIFYNSGFVGLFLIMKYLCSTLQFFLLNLYENKKSVRNLCCCKIEFLWAFNDYKNQVYRQILLWRLNAFLIWVSIFLKRCTCTRTCIKLLYQFTASCDCKEDYSKYLSFFYIWNIFSVSSYQSSPSL